MSKQKKLGLEISTIDKYQDRDNEAIIRLNVTFSRAKHKLGEIDRILMNPYKRIMTQMNRLAIWRIMAYVLHTLSVYKRNTKKHYIISCVFQIFWTLSTCEQVMTWSIFFITCHIMVMFQLIGIEIDNITQGDMRRNFWM